MPIVKIGNHEFFIDGYVKSVLDQAKDVIKKDWDMIFLVDGFEGTGKSQFSSQAAFYCDPTFNINRICFSPREFREAIVNAQPFEAIVYDEAYTGLSSRSAMSMINRTLIQMLAEIRQKNLFVFVVMPSFFDSDKYIALWRSRGLFHIYTSDTFERGYFCFFNVDKKKDLYIIGKKFYNYTKPRANFFGRFGNHYVIDEAAYRRKKKDALESREKKRAEEEMKRELQNELFERLQQFDPTNEKINHDLKMQILDLSRATYFRKLAQYKDHQ